jgi:S1-C subfamily serine protease
MRYFLYGLALFSVLSPATASASELTGPEVYKQSLPGVAYVYGAKLDQGRTAVGTAFLVDADKRLLLTCYHVVRDARTVEVLFPRRDSDGKLVAERFWNDFFTPRFTAQVLAVDPSSDIALIQLKKLPPTARALPLAAAEPEPGEDLHLIGCPTASMALWIYSNGRVRQAYTKKQNLTGDNNWKQQIQCRVVEATLPANSGDSGGPVFNSRGEVVGMLSSVAIGADSLSTAISVEVLRKFVSEKGARAEELAAALSAPKPERLQVAPELYAPVSSGQK